MTPTAPASGASSPRPAAPGRLRLLAVIVLAELRQHLRDPLTLFFMVGVPLLLYPALGAVAQRVVAHARAAADAEVLDVATEPAIDLPDNLRSVPGDPESLVRSGAADAGARRVGETVDLWWDSRSPDSLDARERLLDSLRKARSAAAPRKLKVKDTLTRTERTRESAARLLPALLLFTLLTGGLYTALDLITGEKERGTVETLLSTAADRTVVLGAKFLVVLGFTGASAVLSLASSWASARWVVGLAVPAEAAALALVLFLPMAVLLAAVLCAAAAWAPDFKSGQVLTTPLLVIPLLLGAAPFVPGLTLGPFTATIPVAGLALATREVVAGRYDPLSLTIAFLAACAWAALALGLAARLLGREDIVLGTRGSGQRRLRGDYRADALGLSALAFLTLWFIGQTAQSLDVTGGTVLTQVLCFGSLAFAAPWWLGLPVRETLRLRPAPAAEWARALFVGLSLPFVGLTVQAAQGLFLRTPQAFFAGVFPEEAPLWLLVLVFAVLPGIFEELLFRGAFFGLWHTHASPRAAAWVTALMFGAFHLSVFRFFPTAVLGVLLGLVSVRSRSVLPGMLSHALNNGFAMVLVSLGADLTFEAWMVVPAAAGVALVSWTRAPFSAAGPPPGGPPRSPAVG